MTAPPTGLAAALATGRSYTAIAEDLGVARQTISSWAALPEVQEDLETIRAESLQGALRQLESLRERAVNVVVDVMETRGPLVCKCGAAVECAACGAEVEANTAAPRDRLKGAEMVLDRAGLPKREITELAGAVGLVSPLTQPETAEVLHAAATLLDTLDMHDLATQVRAAIPG